MIAKNIFRTLRPLVVVGEGVPVDGAGELIMEPELSK